MANPKEMLALGAAIAAGVAVYIYTRDGRWDLGIIWILCGFIMLFCSVGKDELEENKKTDDYPESKMKTAVEPIVIEDDVPKKEAEDNIDGEDALEEKEGNAQ